MLSENEIESRFGFHKATIEGRDATKPKHAELRQAYKEFAKYLNDVLPPGRYKVLAFADLEAASMWSHKAIAETAPIAKE